MRLIIVSGLSGSGKSVALNVLEDLGFYCIDNLPVALVPALVDELLTRKDTAYGLVALGLDARNAPGLVELPRLIKELRGKGMACELIFLQADDDVLLSRFSETRRKHPLTSKELSLVDAVASERQLLAEIGDMADLIVDTSATTVYDLRDLLRNRVGNRKSDSLSILIESFGYKHGLPADADFVFDVRCLPNPYWEPTLRHMCGKDQPVKDFLKRATEVGEMIDDIVGFLERWIPYYQNFQRPYLTIAIGCTGGQHRSVYIAEEVARRLSTNGRPVQTRHHELRLPVMRSGGSSG
ncbi:MAG TPA: RNase adapter RapZ [Gammaproteobacteria bacterium]|jgi:UPF0042 nucleotide-binding protein